MNEDNSAFSRHRRAWLEQVARGALGAATIPFLIKHALAEEVAQDGVYRFSGAVSINNQPAKVGRVVKPGDTVTTGPGGSAVFVMGKNAHLLHANSRIEFPGSGLVSQAMRVVTGKILSVFGKGEMQISSATATIGIRGTAAYIEAEPELTYICTCYGVADLQSTEKPSAQEIVKTLHHESPRYIRAGSSGTLIHPAPVINHTDQELIMLEALVGRVPPFVGKPGINFY